MADSITRDDLGQALIPPEYATQIIQDAPKASVMLSRANVQTMSTKTRTQPVLSQKPMAHWVGGDNGLKQTTKQMWKDLTITAEELAAIVPIPEAVLDDANIPLWPQVMPRLASAIGYKLDEAALFGTDKPSSFPTAIIPGAIAAGNTVTEGTGKDLAQDVASLGLKLAQEGYAANGFATAPGFNWKLVGMRSDQGAPIYTPSLSADSPSALYGYPLNEVNNGAWNPTVASLLAADWSNFVVAVRQDITYKLLDQAVISDESGKVVMNLAQQDMVALRVTFRVGFQIANPVNDVQSDETKRYPAAVLVPASAPSGQSDATKAAK